MSEIKFSTWLAADAMYYYAAQRSLQQAAELKPQIDRLNRARQEDSAESQPHIAEQDSSGLYGPYLESLAAVHVMAASSLEAHINYEAEESLSDSDFGDFDKLSLEGKWRFLPLLLRCASEFSRGTEPFQGLIRLTKRRNRLVHYKKRIDPSALGGPPSFLGGDGLTFDAAAESMQTAASMIRTFSNIRGAKEPYWLSHGSYQVFSWSISGLFNIEE